MLRPPTNLSNFLGRKRLLLSLARYPYMQDKSFVKKVNPLYSFTAFEKEERKATHKYRGRIRSGS
jgi:hypothetical protein